MLTAIGCAARPTDRSEFRGGLKQLGIEISSSELTQVMSRLDRDGDGRQISIRSFVRFAEESGVGNTSDLAEMLRAEIKRLARTERGRPNLKRAFEEFDRNDSGRIDRREFRDELRRMGFEIGSDELTQLIERFDVDGDGKVNYREFAKFVEDGGELHGDDADVLISNLRDVVRRAEEEQGISLREAFEHFDRDRSGEIDEDEFHSGLRKLRMTLSRHEAKELMERFPGGRRGRIVYRDFVKVVADRGGDSSGGRDERGRGDDDGILKRLRDEIARLAKTARGPPNYRQVFNEFDRDGNGTIGACTCTRHLSRACVCRQASIWHSLSLTVLAAQIVANSAVG